MTEPLTGLDKSNCLLLGIEQLFGADVSKGVSFAMLFASCEPALWQEIVDASIAAVRAEDPDSAAGLQRIIDVYTQQFNGLDT